LTDDFVSWSGVLWTTNIVVWINIVMKHVKGNLQKLLMKQSPSRRTLAVAGTGVIMLVCPTSCWIGEIDTVGQL
jgi:hypothetical protein